jgi:hypothetical protein
VTRDEHLEWAKSRALEYLDRGDLASAVASMCSDLGKHPETASIGESMALLGIWYVAQKDETGVRHFIEGFR